jgi:hypothetical protein
MSILKKLHDLGFVKILDTLYNDTINSKNDKLDMTENTLETKREIEEYSLLLKTEIIKAVETLKETK